MPSPRQTSLSSAASAVALAAEETVATVGAAALPRMIDADMGDSASKPAMARLNQAVADLRAIASRPILQQAVAAIRADDAKGAAELALQALRRDERNSLAWHILAVAREKCGDYKSALSSYESALLLSDSPGDIANDLGRVAFRLGLKELAAKLFAHYRAAYPDCPQGANNLACALRDLHDYTGAVGVLRPAIMAHPEDASLWNTLGTVVTEQGEAAASQTFFQEALRIDPNFAKARYNLANTRLDLGDADTALIECDAAMRTASTPSDLAMMRLARSTIQLCRGKVREGWADYEARLDPDFAGSTQFLIDRPLWTPDHDLAGKSLLMMGEQGLGDEVCFANLVADVLEALGPDGRLSMTLEPRLIALFQRSFPQAAFSAHTTLKVNGQTIRGAPGVDLSAIDLWTPMASLLQRFRPSVEAYPDHRGYLKPEPERIAHWRAWLATLPGPRLGLLWKSLKLDGARLKQFSPFDQWRPVLAVPGASFVNLQYGDCEAELAQARETLGLTIHQPPGIDLKNDLDDLAALCCAMDLIIGPANATSSIAGACGAPVWFISAPGAWPRLGTDRYPWYPSVRAFIPRGFNQWDELMPRVAIALGDYVSAFPGTTSA